MSETSSQGINRRAISGVRSPDRDAPALRSLSPLAAAQPRAVSPSKAPLGFGSASGRGL